MKKDSNNKQLCVADSFYDSAYKQHKIIIKTVKVESAANLDFFYYYVIGGTKRNDKYDNHYKA